MINHLQHLNVSTPGRICLFGEHQDYLNLPVIPCAISLRISVEGIRRRDGIVRIELPDIRSRDDFSIHDTANYVVERDYFRSSVNVLRRAGYSFSNGFDCIVRGKIPIQAGTSSSSALVVSWINFLTQMSDEGKKLKPEEIGRLAHQAEVVEFGEPGGMMDQFSTAYGGSLFLEFHPSVQIHKLSPTVHSFVLGDSHQQKDTKFILSRVKDQVLDIVREISASFREFSLQTVQSDQIEHFTAGLNRARKELLLGTLRNRDITRRALAVLRQVPLDEKKFGLLMGEHHAILRDVLKISTPKIDRMLEAANKAGAYGGKINGSGGGGCMFVYAPVDPEMIAEAITMTGGKAYIVQADEGTRNEPIEEKG